MMQIFYIDWQQHWEYDRNMNIGANAHSERTVSTKQPQLSSDRLEIRWQLGVQWHRRGLELVFKSLDCFTKRLFHSATIFFCCYICICCLKLHQADYQIEDSFLPWLGGEARSSNIFTICAVYWSLDCRGYFGVSNVTLALTSWLVANCLSQCQITGNHAPCDFSKPVKN